MKKMTKSILFAMAIMTILFAVSVPVGAKAADDTLMPLWDNTGIVTIVLSFSEDGSCGYAESVVNGHPGVTKIVADVYVYRQSGSSWIYVTEQHNTTYSTVNGMSCQFVPVSGAYYRADFTFTVTKNGVDEVITKTKYNTCP